MMNRKILLLSVSLLVHYGIGAETHSDYNDEIDEETSEFHLEEELTSASDMDADDYAEQLAKNQLNAFIADAPDVGTQSAPAPVQDQFVYNAQPWVKKGVHVSIYGDYFYGTSTASNLQYVNQNIITSDDLISRKSLRVKNEWSSGFRVGIDYGFKAQGWDVSLDWFYFNNEAHSHATPPAGGGLVYEWASEWNGFFVGGVGSDALGPVTEASGKWKLTLNQLDLTFGKEFFISKYYSLRPQAGFRAVWLKEKLSNRLFRGVTDNTLRTFEKNDFTGVGLKIGLENFWHFGYGLSLTGYGDVAIVYGPNDMLYRASQTYESLPPGFTVPVLGAEIPADMKDVIPMVDLGLYLKWQETFCKDKFGFALRAGYEYHVLINGFTTWRFIQNDGGIAEQLSSNTNVCIQGLIVGADFSF